MLTMWKFLRRSGQTRVVTTGLRLVLAVIAGMLIHARLTDPTSVERVIENTKIVTVNVPVLSEKIVTKYVTDPKDKVVIAELLDRNKKLQVEVMTLSHTIAELSQSGGTHAGGVVTPPTPENPTYTYKDFQLTAVYHDVSFDYTLHQTFEVLSTTGRDKDGKPVGLTNVFQIGPNGERIPIPAKTVVVFADRAAKRWMASPRIQAGLGVTSGFASSRLGPSVDKVGFVALQWLKRGKSSAAEDVSFAVLSPAVFVGKERHVGVLPFSFNLGTLPRQPFVNVWVSPFVSRTRSGAVVSATF